MTTVEMVGGVEKHERRIRPALGPAAVQVEHIGSTSVPGLAAKPIIDVLVTVDDTTAEEDYLEVGDVAAEDYLLFRDRLRADARDRELYERTKRALVAQDWGDMNAYAEAKTGVIAEIKERARASRR